MAKRKKRRKAAVKKRSRRPGVAQLTIAQLEAMIVRRRAAEAKRLREKRAKIAKDLAVLDRQIAALGGAPRRRRKRVVRKKHRVRVKAKGAKKKRRRRVAKGPKKRIRSSVAQIARVQAAVLKALKGKKKGLLKIELAKAVRSRPQTLQTAVKKLIATRKVKVKGVTRNTRYLAA